MNGRKVQAQNLGATFVEFYFLLQKHVTQITNMVFTLEQPLLQVHSVPTAETSNYSFVWVCEMWLGDIRF